MKSFNPIEAVEYVNKIIESVRCATCDKLEGCRLRYRCGHSACEDCVLYTGGCPACSPASGDAAPSHDQQWTHVVQHATTLLETCHKLFGPEAFQHKRLSEQLKIEREVFPQCIQAPLKYQNRRKSSKYSLDNKENRYSTILDGEMVSCKDNRMENSVTYVQQWLNRNEKTNLARKSFADLNISTQKINNSKNKNVTHNRLANEIPMKNVRKRSHGQCITKDSFFANDIKSTNECGVTSRKPKKQECKIVSKKAKKELSYISDVQRVVGNDESGIFMDNEPIVIDESQETRLDKDQQAWLAVLRAHDDEHGATSRNRQNSGLSNNQMVHSTYDITSDERSRVPLYNCGGGSRGARPQPAAPVVVSVGGDGCVVTVTVHRAAPGRRDRSTRCVAVQTDRAATSVRSEDLSGDDREILEQRDTTKGVVIAETDSDSEGAGPAGGAVCVRADVHLGQPRGVLPGRAGRASSDSSDKENLDPNRHNTRNTHKKKHYKKFT